MRHETIRAPGSATPGHPASDITPKLDLFCEIVNSACGNPFIFSLC